MAEPFLGEIRIMSFDFAPKGWAMCNGQLLPINQNQALFALLGTMYGGNGQTNFALPNMQSRVPVHVGPGFTQGQSLGEAAHTVTVAEMPAHAHNLSGKAATADASTDLRPIPPGPDKALAQAFAQQSDGSKVPVNIYGGGAASGAMAPQTIGNTGGSQPHENRQPYLGVNICIALQGIFPSRN